MGTDLEGSKRVSLKITTAPKVPNWNIPTFLCIIFFFFVVDDLFQVPSSSDDQALECSYDWTYVSFSDLIRPYRIDMGLTAKPLWVKWAAACS